MYHQNMKEGCPCRKQRKKERCRGRKTRRRIPRRKQKSPPFRARRCGQPGFIAGTAPGGRYKEPRRRTGSTGMLPHGKNGCWGMRHLWDKPLRAQSCVAACGRHAMLPAVPCSGRPGPSGRSTRPKTRLGPARQTAQRPRHGGCRPRESGW